MKKAMLTVFLGVLIWFVVSSTTGAGKVSIYNVSDFISPFYVQLGDIILYLLFGAVIYTTGIFIYHIYSLSQEKKVLNGTYKGLKDTVRKLLLMNPATEESDGSKKSDSLWNVVKDDNASLYAEIFRGINEEDLKSKQDFLNACEIRAQDLSSQKKRDLTFYNYIGITAPTLGFLGTAVGMVAIFDDVGVAGAEQLGADLKIALITTVAGLAIRFFAMFCKTILESLQDDFSEAVVTDLKEILA